MRLIHYSERIIPKIWQVEYSNKHQSSSGKPKGFWVSVNEGWKQWCEEAEFALDRLAYCHEIKLHKKHECLVIKNRKQLLEFIEEYGCDMYKSCGFSDDFPRPPIMLLDMSKSYIDWRRLYPKYKGIIFTKYDRGWTWSSKYSLCTWWSGLDCASGCIWDVSAIKSCTLIRDLDSRAD